MKAGIPFDRLRAGSAKDPGLAQHERVGAVRADGGRGRDGRLRWERAWRWVPAADAGMAEGTKTGGSETPPLRKIPRVFGALAEEAG